MKSSAKLCTAIVCSLLLAGCLSTTLELPPTPTPVHCPSLPLLSDGSDMGDMVLDDVAIAGLYAECARRNAGWIEWAEKAKAATKQ